MELDNLDFFITTEEEAKYEYLGCTSPIDGKVYKFVSYNEGTRKIIAKDIKLDVKYYFALKHDVKLFYDKGPLDESFDNKKFILQKTMMGHRKIVVFKEAYCIDVLMDLKRQVKKRQEFAFMKTLSHG